MIKRLEELAEKEGFASIKSMYEKELLNSPNIQYKTQKSKMIERLNNCFNGQFIDGYNDCTYGNFLSRALTAYVLSKDFDIPEEEAATYITDDNHDFGIDAIYFHKNRIYIYQTKFSNSIDRDSIKVIKDGISMFFSYEENEKTFNQHFSKHKKRIIDYTYNEELKITLRIIFFGEQVSQDIISFLENEIKSNKDYGDFIENCEIYKKKDILDYEITNNPIDNHLLLDNYFERDEPLKMYSGCIKVNTLTNLYKEYGKRLFSKNIRYLVKSSTINKGIQDTLKNEPNNFIYYNNGITITCDNITVLPNSSTSKTLRNLKLYNLNIVNGAQTVISSSLLDEEISDSALIQVRIIQTKHEPSSPIDLADNITKYNNSQNAVHIKDLRTLDPIHKDIKREFIKWGYYYKCKTGEECIENNDIDFEDLFISLACYNSYSYIAKTNKGRIWETNLYNELLKIRKLETFLKISIMKKRIDSHIAIIEKDDINISHWDRLILELFYKKHFTDSMQINELENLDYNTLIQNIYSKINNYISEKKHIYRTRTTYQNLSNIILEKNEPIVDEESGKQLNLF